jgi:hypothetical protein
MKVLCGPESTLEGKGSLNERTTFPLSSVADEKEQLFGLPPRKHHFNQQVLLAQVWWCSFSALFPESSKSRGT